MTPKKKYILDAYGREPESLDELAHCVIAVINSQKNSDPWETKKSRKYKNHRVVGFAWDISRSESVSNSHSAPEGFRQNWAGRETMEDGTPVPRGYPGWTGRVWIRYEDDPYSFSSSGAFERTLTHTGTGGAGSYDGFTTAVASARWQRYGYKAPRDAYPEIHNFSWDFRFYDADWPKIAEWYEKMKLVAILSDTQAVTIHRFEWQDPDMMIRDSEFIAECALVKAKKEAA